MPDCPYGFCHRDRSGARTILGFWFAQDTADEGHSEVRTQDCTAQRGWKRPARPLGKPCDEREREHPRHHTNQVSEARSGEETSISRQDPLAGPARPPS
jgi:hypothetical protein